MICPQCQQEVNENVTFCPYCGARLEAPQTNSSTISSSQTEQFQYNTQPVLYRTTNGMCVAGFVLSFFIPLLGIIFSAIGLKQTGQNGEGGRGLAIAGLVLSIIWIAIALRKLAGIPGYLYPG